MRGPEHILRINEADLQTLEARRAAFFERVKDIPVPPHEYDRGMEVKQCEGGVPEDIEITELYERKGFQIGVNLSASAHCPQDHQRGRLWRIWEGQEKKWMMPGRI